MSGRIRTIKPELLDDAVTAGLSDTAFRLFIACIVLADDYGRLRLEPAWLQGQVFWARPIHSGVFTSAIAELTPLILSYTVNGQRYGEIKNWQKHQRVSHPGKPRVPPPEETLSLPSGDLHEDLVPDPDLRSPIPISDPDHRPPSCPRDGPVDEVTAVRARPGPEPTVTPPEIGADTVTPPPWFVAAGESAAMVVGEIPELAAKWLVYKASRGRKGWSKNHEDAVGWLVDVAGRERREAADKRTREAQWAKQRTGPGTLTETTKPSPEAEARALAGLRSFMANRKGAA